MVEWVVPWVKAFVLTQLIEIPIWVNAQRSIERSMPRKVAIGFAASALTHPIVWFVFPWVFERIEYWQMVALAELFAFLVEWGWISLFGVKRPWFWSLIANGASFGVGLVLYALDLL